MNLDEKNINSTQPTSSNLVDEISSSQKNDHFPIENEAKQLNLSQLSESEGAIQQEKKSRKKLLYSAILIVLILLLSGGVYVYLTRFAKDALAQTFDKMSGISSYSQDISYTVKSGDQKVDITGTIDFDVKNEKSKGHLEASGAGTSQGMSFSTDTISIGKVVYLKTSSSNPILGDLMPKDWLRLDTENLPEEMKAQLQDSEQTTKDNLSAFFEKSQSFLSVKSKQDETSGDQKLVHYTLSLSPAFLDQLSADQKSFFENMTKGDLEIWINKKSFLTEKISFKGPDNEFSSTIKNVNQPVRIEAPASSVTYEEFQAQIASSFLSKTPVNEIFLGYYGDVRQPTIDRIKNIITDNFGVKVTVLSGGQPAFPNKNPFYDSARKQFDADYIWESLSSFSTQYGQGVRQLFITNSDLFTKIQPDRPYIFTRALPDTNTALISINRILKASDSDSSQASSDLYYSRLDKLVLRTLGVTVGLSGAPSASDINCVMYQYQNLKELDTTGKIFCEDQKAALKKVFVGN